MVVAGDYLAEENTDSVEGAVLSGLEAANRVSQWTTDYAKKIDQHDPKL